MNTGQGGVTRPQSGIRSADVAPNLRIWRTVMDTHQVQPQRLLLAERLRRGGGGAFGWALGFLLVFFGALKWTAAEAQGVAPLIAHSPFLSWTGRLLGQQGASEAIGVIELLTATLIALRWWSPRLAIVGGALGVAMFVTTLSF